MNRLLASFPVLLLVCLAPARAEDIEKPDAAGIEFFESQVRPLLIARCYKCHSQESENVRGGLLLDSRTGWMAGGDSGRALVAGDPDASLVVKAIRYDGDVQMPPEGKLPEREIAALTEWVKRGAPDPRAGAKAAKPKRAVNVEEERKHWAYQPLLVSQPPEIDSPWARTPVDRFVLAKLNEAQLAPNPVADRRTLIRRAYFDLVGLPPTPEEVAAFVADPASDAYERLVDRLLDSPHYGERWGRHWLDLARFAESHGFEHDYDRLSAYHYRDFVIQALNQDLPFDTFVRWQLAGDEIEPENPLALMATGYLAAGVHSTQITKNQVEKERYDELDDILGTVGTSLLGLTFGCARCHDHKFDAIPNTDYYRMLSTFTTAVRSEMELNLEQAAYNDALAQYSAAHEPLTAAVARYEAEQLPAKFDTWRTAHATPQQPAAWQILAPTSVTSTGGATFATQDDGSYLASGTRADNDIYTIVARTNQRVITALRLEALADDSLPHHGPGRADNGNFALSSVEVKVAPAGREADATLVKLASARATFEQPKLAVADAIDEDKTSAWAVDGQIGKNQAAAFEFAVPIGYDEGTVLTVTLKFDNNKGHAIGRPRLAITTAASSTALDAESASQNTAEVEAILARSGGQPAADAKADILRWFAPLDAQWQALSRAEREHAAQEPQPTLTKVLVTSEGVPAVRLHTQGGDFLPETHFLERGDPNRKKDVATQSFLQALMTSPTHEQAWQTAPPDGWRTSYRRRAMADWITDTKSGAGPLLARVIVNRVWQHHLGRGIVATPSDFGTQGARPTHPELLDYLADELIAGGWKLKQLHRQIMTSAVYMQGAESDDARAKIDADDKLLWRRARHRLEAEVIRDAMLAAGGVLDETMYGPGTLDESQRRRSIYFTVKRSKLVPMMVLFDAPDALQGIGERATTTIAPQALMLINSPTARDAARGFAGRIASGDEGSWAGAVNRAYEIAFAREPRAEELADAAAFLDAQLQLYTTDKKEDARQAALTDFCQVLFGLNEFVYVE